MIVTPCVGVWIEILMDKNNCKLTTVTPCVGVWIEIACVVILGHFAPSLPVWECGLKSRNSRLRAIVSMVTPCVGVWIEIFILLHVSLRYLSLPVWECGLKLVTLTSSMFMRMGHSLCGSVD